MARRLPAFAAAAAAAAVLAGCSGTYTGPGGSTGNTAQTLVSAELSAQPAQGFDRFYLYLSGVQLVNANDTTSTFNVWRTKATYDLLALPGTFGPLLGPVSIPRADYFLRLYVDSVSITLTPPASFANGDTTRVLAIPAALRGFDAVHPVTLSGTRVTWVFDIDAGRSITFTGTRGHWTSAAFTPVIYGIVDTTAVTIAGTVSPAASHDTLYAVVGSDSVATAFNDTTTGAFTLRLVPSPDSVTIRAHGNSFSASRLVVTRLGVDTAGVAIP